jgi:hypothetical protein
VLLAGLTVGIAVSTPRLLPRWELTVKEQAATSQPVPNHRGLRPGGLGASTLRAVHWPGRDACAPASTIPVAMDAVGRGALGAGGVERAGGQTAGR